MAKGRPRNERVSDADRERAVAELTEHAVAGRLDVEELTRRTQQAYTAVTVGDLAEAMRDLPASARPHARRARRRARRRAPVEFRLHLAAYAAVFAADVAVLAATTEQGVGLVVGDGDAHGDGPLDEIATLGFWALVGWGALFVAVRAIYALSRPALPRGNP